MAIKGVNSVELGWQEWQRQAISRITYLAQTGGGAPDRNSPDWRYVGPRMGGVYWNNRGERDMVWFPEDPDGEYKRVPGALIPNDLEPDVAMISNLANRTDEDQPETSIEYERGLVISRREVDQGSLGIAIAAWAEAQGGGGELTGGSYGKVGTSTTMTAEYMHALEKGSDKSKLIKTHIGAIPKARHLTVIEQAIQRGEATVKIKERLILEPAFWYIDWKEIRKDGWLSGNRDYSSYSGGGKNRILWKVDNLADLKAQLEGRHVEYPAARGKNLLGEKWIRYNYEWLANEDNRTIESETTIKFDTVQQSDATIRYIPLEEGD